MNRQQTRTVSSSTVKYQYSKQTYHSPKQIEWLDFTTFIFNIDDRNILLYDYEKRCVIKELSRELTSSENEDFHCNRTVQAVRNWLRGVALVEVWKICASILRCQQQIPAQWLEHRTIRRYYRGIAYLKDCSIGVKTYSRDGIQRAMFGVRPDEFQHEEAAEENNGRLLARDAPTPDVTSHSRPVDQDVSQERKAPESLSPSAVSSSSNSSQVHGQTSPTQDLRQTQGHIERKNPNIKLQEDIEVIEIKDEDDEDAPLMPSAGKNPGPNLQQGLNHLANATAERSAIESQLEAEYQTITSLNTSDAQKTTTELRAIMKFLPNIAVSEDAVFRTDILQPFIADIQSRGWDDLVHWAGQIVDAQGSTYRGYLAGRLREKLAVRIDNMAA
ncbi:hypothetical protein N0V92_000782 [Colletotrichum tropicale]|nr:hypothetical protein N0V92_000782 [Colletotrichum tropicale]